MSDIDELDINPFFKALQTNFLDVYDRAQEECYLICIPKSDCFKGSIITEKFVDTHILKPSPFFKGHYTTLKCEKQIVVVDDNGDFISTVEGFPTRTKIQILSEELGYNKAYKPYKILILERPLDINTLKHRVVENGSSKTEDVQLQYTFTGCKEFLHQYTDFAKAISELEVELEKFNSRYILLKDYLHNAADRLQELIISTAEKCTKHTKDKTLKNVQVNLRDLLTTAVEIYVIGRVYKKLYIVICEKCSTDDSTMTKKCQSLHGVTSQQLSVPQHFCVPVPSAVVELQRMNSLTTPIEKLYCLKNTIDKITEEINVHILSTCTQIPGLPAEDPPCLTSDDLIPILVTVLVEASCKHIHSDIFYIDNFYWLVSTKDKDTLSYCLVTFKAAIHFLMTSDFDDIDWSSVPPKTTSTKLKPVNQSKGRQLSPVSPKLETTSPVNTRARTNHSGKSRLDQQLESINKMLEDNTKDLGPPKNQQTAKPLSSIFGGSSSYSPPPQEVLKQDPEEKKKDMGDFLSSLQDDMFSFGKQN